MNERQRNAGPVASLIDLAVLYGFFGFLRLMRDVIATHLFFRNARLIRAPYYIRGKHRMSLGSNLTTGVGLRLDAFAIDNADSITLKIGANVQINDYVHIAAIERVEIGDNCLIASKVFISDHNHGAFDGNNLSDSPTVPPAERPLRSKPVVIGANVWVGEAVMILPGVTIGEGSVIGAGSVVTRNIPANSVAAGNPARLLRRFDPASCLWERT